MAKKCAFSFGHGGDPGLLTSAQLPPPPRLRRHRCLSPTSPPPLQCYPLNILFSPHSGGVLAQNCAFHTPPTLPFIITTRTPKVGSFLPNSFLFHRFSPSQGLKPPSPRSPHGMENPQKSLGKKKPTKKKVPNAQGLIYHRSWSGMGRSHRCSPAPHDSSPAIRLIKIIYWCDQTW